MMDVIVVGCGPVGALAANLLGQAGLAVLVLEQELQPHPLPRAVHLDHEMMRLFQKAGVIDQVLPDMVATDGHMHVGADHGVIRYMGTVGKPRPFGWANDYFFYQPELEAHLRQGLAAYSKVGIQLGATVIDLVQTEDQVTVEFEAKGSIETASARWVIGCDGSRSLVRKTLGIALEDLDFEEPWLVVDAEVDGPLAFSELTGVPDGADLQRLSIMMCDPKRPATIVPGRGHHRRWEFMLLPGEDDVEMASPEHVRALIRPWVHNVPHRIVRAATYRFHGLIAEKWQAGNVFLAGDAAHQTPPFFGQGMCHGFRDVANLAWKMHAVKAGEASAGLLDTYQIERDPHVRAVIGAAVSAGRYICELDPEKAAARDLKMREQARASQGETAHDLIPAIGRGVVLRGSVAAGERFIQPAPDGCRLDSLTGSGWRLFVRLPPARPTPGSISVYEAGLLADGGAVLEWLDKHQVDAVLVRPDHYIFGTVQDDPSPLVDAWSSAMAGELESA